MTILLQTTRAITNCDKFITKYDSYYKLRQLLQIMTDVLNMQLFKKIKVLIKKIVENLYASNTQ